MNCKRVNKILSDTAYVRTGGTKEELACAEYIKSLCAEMGLEAKIEAFPITMYETKTARLVVDGREIPCKAFNGSESKTVAAGFYYLNNLSSASLKKCKDKIVLLGGRLTFSIYDKLTENNALGIITYNGNICYRDTDIEQKEICFEHKAENRPPIINVNVKDAMALVKANSKFAEITTQQSHYIGESHNVILDIEGESEETIIFSAHYDSSSLSIGAYDNMSSCIALLGLAEYFSANRPKRSIRFLWCGSEERGLLGSEEYCAMHKAELEHTLLNVNLDMVGSFMGVFTAFSCINEQMADFMTKFFKKQRVAAEVKYKIRSSDSNSFIRAGVPAISFARNTMDGTHTIHTRYDTAEMVSAKTLLTDIKLIAKFTEIFANADEIPLSLEITDKIKTDIQNYFKRKTRAVKEF